MKNALFVAVMVIGMVTLSGCKEETKSYGWYLDNKEDAYRVHEKCQKSGRVLITAKMLAGHITPMKMPENGDIL
ncbi:EexN family lipoprotein (plasmid) [Escherichia coli]|nr:EexN family lipoprotein [Escherichia coli]